MCEPHDWLPSLLPWEGGDTADQYPEPTEEYVTRLYQVYERDFEASLPVFRGLPVRPKRHPEFNGRCGTFWHVTSQTVRVKEKRDGTVHFVEKRVVRPHRCERIQWLRPMVVAATDSPERVRVYRVEHQGGEMRWEIALIDYSYVVVVAERTDHYLLWAAFEHEKPNARRKAEKKYQAWLEAQKAEAALPLGSAAS